MELLYFLDKANMDDVHVLAQAIDSFNGAALKFERHYRHLERRVKGLQIELGKKNRALNTNLKEKQEIESYLHNILESLPVGVVVIDMHGNITTFNRSAENITGLISQEVVGRKFDQLLAVHFFQDLQLNFRSLKDIEEHREFETEIYLQSEAPTHVSLSISPLRTPQRDKIGIVLTVQDITQMKRFEEQANRTSRLSAMGEMAAKMAHEIRNPLGSIELFASTLTDDLKEHAESQALAEHISSGVKSINSIICNLLLFIRPEQRAHFKCIDIHVPLKDSLFFSKHLIESAKGIDVVTSFALEPIIVRGDQELLKQTYLNLILNAIQSMPNGGRLTISTREIKDRQGTSKFAEIRFTDTGTGIPRAAMHRIFDPFFTTKGRGTGLGLSIVHNIIKLHEGTIDVNSTELNGTSCIATLPLWGGENGM
ncbi:MAG: PAS domain S-box protein [Thermodesulfobacteriota bacterium]|nr:PAS domain S-box protein [Thermodesulfobacteriota bacterium]